MNKVAKDMIFQLTMKISSLSKTPHHLTACLMGKLEPPSLPCSRLERISPFMQFYSHGPSCFLIFVVPQLV